MPPKVDLLMEKKIGDIVRHLVKKLKIDTVHDISDGGLLIALTEMSVAGNIGFNLDVNQNNLDNGFLFGEDQGRYIILVEDKNLSETIEYIEKNNISYSSIGKSCGNKIIIDKNNEAYIEEIRDLYENWFENYLKVNGRRVNIPSYRVKTTDIIEIKDKSKGLEVVLRGIESSERDIPDYIEVDGKKMTAKITRIPNLTEVPYPVQMEPNLVVEFYSRN